MPRWALALILAAGAGLLYLGHYVGVGRHHPNVVFLLLDTLRADRVGGTRNGIPITPFLREFARTGAYFTNAISPASWTKPALAALFTDTYPDTNHVRYSADRRAKQQESDRLAEAFETLPEYLRDAGYDNWGFQTNENGSAESGFSQGFPKGRYQFMDFVPSVLVVNEALKELPSMKPPFFLFAHLVDPHAPYTPSDEYKTIFGPQPEVSAEDAVHINGSDAKWREYLFDDQGTWMGRQAKRVFAPLSEGGKEALRYRYDAEARQQDDQIARLLRTIEGQYPNTLFVIVSDHGDEFYERGTNGHSHHVYQELVHVPVVLHGPGVPVGDVAAPVASIGILPTIASLLGTPAREQWQVPGLFEQAKHPAPIFTWTRGSIDDGLINVEAVIDGNSKLIDDVGHKRIERYDLASDPGELHNLYTGGAPGEAEALATLNKHRKDAIAAGNAIATVTTTLSDEQKRQLESLGYLKADDNTPVAPPSTGPKPPNVLLVIIDTLRADRVEATRNNLAVMPNLHALATQSVWFQNAVSQASWTKPSVTSILTGLYTQTHGVEYGVQKPFVEGQQMTVQGLAPEKHTILRYLKDHGYSTAAIQTNVHLQGSYGFAAGCDDYEFAKFGNATEVTDKALAAEQHMSPPFAIYAHYFDPHADYAPPEPHRSAFGPLPPLTPEEEDLLTNDYHQRYYLEKAKFDMGLISKMTFGSFSETGREHVRQLYDGECHYTDAELARLIAQVRKDHPDTIVIVTSDHGEEFWEHGGLGHAKTVYQELVHVPMVISVPGAAPRAVNSTVENIDIAPTLAALLKLPADPNWQGRDALADPIAARPAFTETHGSFPEAGLHKEAVIDGDQKLIRDVSKKTQALFNLKDDPGETSDLSPTSPGPAGALGATLDAHDLAVLQNPLAAIPPPVFDLEGKAIATTSSAPSAISEERRRQLESLGYLGRKNTGEVPTAPK